MTRLPIKRKLAEQQPKHEIKITEYLQGVQPYLTGTLKNKGKWRG